VSAGRWFAPVALLAGLVSTGCWSTTIHNAPAVGTAPAGWDDRWHESLFFGSIEMTGPYDLHEVCPHGWSEIRTRTSVYNGLLILLTLDTYSTQTVTVRCAKEADVASR
jgi:hypothetical protein